MSLLFSLTQENWSVRFFCVCYYRLTLIKEQVIPLILITKEGCTRVLEFTRKLVYSLKVLRFLFPLAVDWNIASLSRLVTISKSCITSLPGYLLIRKLGCQLHTQASLLYSHSKKFVFLQ